MPGLALPSFFALAPPSAGDFTEAAFLAVSVCAASSPPYNITAAASATTPIKRIDQLSDGSVGLFGGPLSCDMLTTAAVSHDGASSTSSSMGSYSAAVSSLS